MYITAEQVWHCLVHVQNETGLAIIVENLTEQVGYHVGRHYSAGIAHDFSIARIAAKQVEYGTV